MVDLSVSLAGLELDNPVIPASGVFGYGQEYKDFYDINVLGSISVKGTTAEPRFGNPTPRIAECKEGMLNSVGLQNPGIAEVVGRCLPELKKIYRKKVILNVSGFSVDEYAYCAAAAEKADNVGIIEVNVSCPNVHDGGMAFGTKPENVLAVTRAVKKASTRPVFVKLSPNVTDITETALAAAEGGADGISLINTLVGMRIDLKTRRPVLAAKSGGFSGPAIFPIALRMVYQVFEAVKLPIMGIGGISSAEDVMEMMLAGATAVQVGAANLVSPTACRDIINDLPRAMKKYNVTKLSDIIGEAHK